MLKNDDIIINAMGVTTQQTAADCSQKGGNLLKNILKASSCKFLSLSGIRKDGVSVCTFVTPAGSFFVPDVTIGGKSRKTFQTGGRLMPYTKTIAEELRTAVRCSRRVALRATKGQTTTRSRDLNRINLATLEANVLSIAEKADMEMELRQEQGEDHPSPPTRP